MDKSGGGDRSARKYGLNRHATDQHAESFTTSTMTADLMMPRSERRPSSMTNIPEVKGSDEGDNDSDSSFFNDGDIDEHQTQKISFSPSMNYAKLNNTKLKFGKLDKLQSPMTDNIEGYLRIQVIDSGEGIKHEAIPKLFKKYGKVRSESHRIDGSGLGLWISK